MPERSCLFCRNKSEKQSLLRFVWQNEKLVWDRDRILTGRGVYAEAECLEKGLPPEKVWGRALRLDINSISQAQIKGLLKEVLKEIKNEQNQNL